MRHLIAIIQDEIAIQVAQLYQDKMSVQHGIPLNTVSDKDSKLTGAFWQNTQNSLSS